MQQIRTELLDTSVHLKKSISCDINCDVAVKSFNTSLINLQTYILMQKHKLETPKHTDKHDFPGLTSFLAFNRYTVADFTFEFSGLITKWAAFQMSAHQKLTLLMTMCQNVSYLWICINENHPEWNPLATWFHIWAQRQISTYRMPARWSYPLPLPAPPPPYGILQICPFWKSSLFCLE